MVNFMAEKAREARLIGAASGSCRQTLLERGEVEGRILHVALRRKGEEEGRPEV